jgi:hypothetical protein
MEQAVAWADLAPVPSQSTPTTVAVSTVTTAPNLAAGDTNNSATGTLVFVVVTAIIIIGAVAVFLRARANRLKASS